MNKSGVSVSSSTKYYISDFKLLRRLREYMKDVDDIEGINKDSMIEDLRVKYKEYGRRQKSAFRALVLRAYKMILEEMNKIQDNVEEDESDKNGDQESNIDLDENYDDDDDDDGENDDGSEDEDGKDKEEEEDDDNEVEGLEIEEESMIIDEPIELDSTNSNKSPKEASSYMERITKMTSQSAPKASEEDLINISSDEDAPAPSSDGDKDKYKNMSYRIVRNLNPSHRTARKSRTYDPQIESVFHLPQVNITAVPNGKGTNKRPSELSTSLQPKRRKLELPTAIPRQNFKSFGGFSKILKTISELVIHIKETDIYDTLGVNPPRGFLLHGPPGSGKTLLANAIAGELEVPLVGVCAAELVTGISGESESKIRNLFGRALGAAPCVLFIDEIDTICPPRDQTRREMERRMVAQLLSCIDGLSDWPNGNNIAIIGATNRPEGIDPALRRAGRFDREICLGMPDRPTRFEILQVLTNNMKLRPGLDLEWLASATPGYIGADLNALMAQAAIAAVNRCIDAAYKKLPSTSQSTSTSEPKAIMVNGVNHSEEDTNDQKKEDDDVIVVTTPKKEEETGIFSILKSKSPLMTPEILENLYIEAEDFEKALKAVQPSAKREGFATVPDVTWDDIGSLRDIRNELEKSILMPVKYPKEFETLGISAPTGVLLCGPPGCGKTLLAKAVANEAHINFISVKGPELLNMYVGESERAVRQVFQRARNSQPCVIFFDEIDALCPKRTASSDGHNTTSRVVNQVLTEMDGVEDRSGVFLMAATNRPDMVDPAVLRPGRLDKILYVGLPSAADRTDILRALTKNGTKPPMKDVDLESVGASSELEGFTGADLAALVKEAAVMALSEYIESKEKNELFVSSEMFRKAAAKIRPSVSPKEREQYEKLRIAYGLPSKNVEKDS